MATITDMPLWFHGPESVCTSPTGYQVPFFSPLYLQAREIHKEWEFSKNFEQEAHFCAQQRIHSQKWSF